MKDRKQLVEVNKKSGLSIRKQCRLLNVNRGLLYYTPQGESALNLELMRLMDPHLLEHPTEGVESMVYFLADQGYQVNSKRIRRLFGLMGYTAICHKRNLSKLGQAKYVKPYLLRNLDIKRANQVWSTDITYIPMVKGFMYLTAIMDVYSRKTLSWGLSNTMTADWCLEVLQQAIDRYGKPEIVNSDQGSQYTSHKWCEFLTKNTIQISMDGKGRATDNAWIERFWKSIKYDHIYIQPVDNCKELRQGIEKHIGYYNNKTHHTTKQKPDLRYSDSILEKVA